MGLALVKTPALTAPSKIRDNGLISRWISRRIGVTGEKNVDTTVDAARLEARATKRKRAWAIGPCRSKSSRHERAAAAKIGGPTSKGHFHRSRSGRRR